MDSRLLSGGGGDSNPGNLIVRELLQVLADFGIVPSASRTDQVSTAVKRLCWENEPLYYENEPVITYL